MIEWAGVGALAGLAVAGTTVVTFWMNFSAKIGEAKSEAAAALRDAAEAKKIASETNMSNAALAAAFGLHREQIAREYIHRETMREVETRLTAAIDRLGDRLDRVLEGRNETRP